MIYYNMLLVPNRLLVPNIFTFTSVHVLDTQLYNKSLNS